MGIVLLMDPAFVTRITLAQIAVQVSIYELNISNDLIANIPLLQNGISTSADVTTSARWDYYTIRVVNTTFLSITLRETNSVGFVWLYTSKGRLPDTRIYDYSDQETNSQFHRIHIIFDQPETDNWIIGVYANPFALTGEPVPYSVAAWYSPF